MDPGHGFHGQQVGIKANAAYWTGTGSVDNASEREGRLFMAWTITHDHRSKTNNSNRVEYAGRQDGKRAYHALRGFLKHLSLRCQLSSFCEKLWKGRKATPSRACLHSNQQV
jgi:hypothetical protein